MKKKITLVLLFVVLCGAFYACRKDFLPDEEKIDLKTTDPKVKMDLALAKKYYYKTLKPEQGNIVKPLKTSISSDSRPNRKYVEFKKAYTSETANITFVEVPLAYNQRPAIIVGKKDTYNKAENQELFYRTFDRLLIFKDKKTGKIDQRIVTYIPDKAYADKHNRDVSHNQINKLDKDFNGYLVYKTWDGTAFQAVKVQNGKKTKTFKLKKTNVKKTNTIKQIVCEWFFSCTFVETCYWTDPEGADMECTIEIENYMEWEECWDDGYTGDDCIDFGICDEEPAPCGYSYNKSGARISNDCANVFPDNQAIQLFEIDYKGQMSAAELAIYNGMSRLEQLMYLYNAKNAIDTAESLYPGLSQHNTVADAVRHAYFNALNCNYLGFDLAKSLADAHENIVNNPPLEKAMDLHNNQMGRTIFHEVSNNGGIWGNSDLLEAIQEASVFGELRVISNGQLVNSN